MRQNHTISLLQSNYTTIKVIYSLHLDIDEAKCKQYTFKCAFEVKEGDLVVTNNFKIVKVVEVDASPQIDLDANFDYAWVIDKVDTSWYDQITQAEESMKQDLLNLEAKKKQTEVLEGLKSLYGEQDIPQLDCKDLKEN